MSGTRSPETMEYRWACQRRTASLLFDLAPPVALPSSDRSNENERLRCTIEMETSCAPPAEQFGLFRSWYAGLADIKPIQNALLPFPAHQMAWSFGRLTLTYLSAPEVSFAWRNLKNPIMDSWCLHLALPRTQPLGGTKVRMLSLCSLADAFWGFSERSDHIALYVPSNLRIIQSSRIALREEAKQFLMDYMLALFRQLPNLRNADVGHIDAAITNLLAACLMPSRDHIAKAQRPIEAAIVSRVSRIIEKHLANPALTPSLICREIGVSRSRLYRIFEPIGGVSSYIRRERLRKTRDALENSADSRPIFTIAEQCGFWDPSTYSRMFKKEFGVSPSDARSGGFRGVVSARSTDATTLRDLLFSNY
jgi:AraC-like DNA-binding protein